MNELFWGQFSERRLLTEKFILPFIVFQLQKRQQIPRGGYGN